MTRPPEPRLAFLILFAPLVAVLTFLGNFLSTWFWTDLSDYRFNAIETIHQLINYTDLEREFCVAAGVALSLLISRSVFVRPPLTLILGSLGFGMIQWIESEIEPSQLTRLVLDMSLRFGFQAIAFAYIAQRSLALYRRPDVASHVLWLHPLSYLLLGFSSATVLALTMKYQEWTYEVLWEQILFASSFYVSLRLFIVIDRLVCARFPVLAKSAE
jgi:hypothetical protein